MVGRDIVTRAFSKRSGPAGATDLMVAVKSAQEEYRCGESHVAAYASSPNEAIASSAKGVSQALAGLRVQDEEIIKELRLVLDGEVDSTKAGTQAERNADRTMAINKLWQHLMLSVVGASHAIVDINPRTQRADRFTLTAPERAEVIRRLEKDFGPALKRRAARTLPLEASVSMLLKFLKDKEWKSRDKR